MTACSLPILDFIASAQARDEGIQKVATNNSEWMALALIELEQLSRNHTGWSNLDAGITGEDIRNMLIPRVGHPSSPHGWGSLIMHAVRRKIIFDTNTRRPMKDVRSHSRKTPVYSFVASNG